ncbi:arginine--tRNA ligase [Ruminococcus sp. HUN007]|uniref:arginine--tRNA ligase n=1 Tax=Ruminococcus sp. HUN007 TaxID=1514668 RepID=UPI0005D18E86|nr:arginine--tRNA ligase [Ruminococcus sp. HUN007]
MKTITQILTEKVSDAFEKCGYDRALGAVFVSDRMDLCQFQCNGSFAAAKQYKKAPFIIAEEIKNVLSDDPDFEKVEVAKPGFINMTMTDEYLVKLLAETADDAHIGIPQVGCGDTIVMDYGGPNVAKPLHIGHLRSAIIGESLKRLARECGYNVVSDVHLGDWGLQIGLVIAELEERNPEWDCFKEDFKDGKVPELTADMLNEIYPFASKKSKENEEFKAKAHKFTADLQNGRPGYIAVWKEILRVSINDLKGNYEKLGVDFDYWYGESDADKYIDELVSILTDKGLLYKSEGAMVVDVAEESDKAPMPPVIIKKSDNSSIYATTDLATIIQRNRDFAPKKIWYVVDKRQDLHFTQVFRCARKAELVPADTELELLGFGTMNGSDGKPYKTRDGGVMKLSDLIETVTNAAAEKLRTSEFVSAEDHSEIAKRVGIAAVKFGDLINHRSKDYIFDIDKFLSFEGKTGTYLLYTVSRINSILKKTNTENSDAKPAKLYTDAERELILAILLTGDVFRHAIDEKAPNYVCENAYKLAVIFSKFYHDNHILGETDEAKKKDWLALISFTRKLILKHLEILAIEPVENM